MIDPDGNTKCPSKVNAQLSIPIFNTSSISNWNTQQFSMGGVRSWFLFYGINQADSEELHDIGDDTQWQQKETRIQNHCSQFVAQVNKISQMEFSNCW